MSNLIDQVSKHLSLSTSNGVKEDVSLPNVEMENHKKMADYHSKMASQSSLSHISNAHKRAADLHNQAYQAYKSGSKPSADLQKKARMSSVTVRMMK